MIAGIALLCKNIMHNAAFICHLQRFESTHIYDLTICKLGHETATFVISFIFYSFTSSITSCSVGTISKTSDCFVC